MSSPLVDVGGHAVNIGNSPVAVTPEHQDVSTVLLETLAFIIAFYVAFCSLSSKTTSLSFLNYWNIQRNLGLDIANKLISSSFAILASFCGIYVLFTYGGRYYYSQFITYMMPCGMGYFLYDIFAMYQVYQSNQEASKGVEVSFKSYIYNNPLMFLHHILLSTFFIPIMINRRDHPGGDPMLACALIMESSTPFVSMRAILYNLNLRHSWIYVVNGLIMVIIFFLCRIAVYPWFYYVHGSARGLTTLEAVISTPPRCALWMILVLILQLHWFRIMFLGAIKVIMEKFCSEKKREIVNTSDAGANETKED